MEQSKIYIKRKRKINISKKEKFMLNLEEFIGYWRANPQRFIIEYLGLKLYDFQKILIYQMFMFPKFIFIASRGLAKSTLSLIFAIAYAILYPNSNIIVVAPTKSQSQRFVKKINELKRNRPNLENEIKKDGIKLGVNECSIEFNNGSKIITLPYSENALGSRGTVLIVDEFVRTEKEVITRVFVPMLTSPRIPPYIDLTKEERELVPEEPNRQLYLSSIRGADEWSYKYFETYIEEILKGSTVYTTISLPYNFGVKNGYISKDTVEQSFKENQENIDVLLAEYTCRPERGNGNPFYKYASLNKRRDNAKSMVCMSDDEFALYKDNKSKFPYYVEKLPNEIRILTMDVALVESSKNDNSSLFMIRLIPDGGKYKRIISYSESMHGVNSVIQTKRAKQVFYEFECDYFVLDANGMGMGIFDIATAETYDEERGVVYPAWTAVNPEALKGNTDRAMSRNAVPLIYIVITGIRDKSRMLVHMRDLFSTDLISLLVDTQEAVEYLNKKYKYYGIDNSDLKFRMLNSYAQTSLFINEAINLEQIVVQGYLSAREKSTRRKDRVMSLAYGLWYANVLEEKLDKYEDTDILAYIITA